MILLQHNVCVLARGMTVIDLSAYK